MKFSSRVINKHLNYHVTVIIITIIIIFLNCGYYYYYFIPPVIKIPGVKNTKLKTKSGVAASPCRLDEENCL